MQVYNNDKTGKAKTYFNNVITGVYFIYTPRSLYWNKSIEERTDIVNKDYLKGERWEKIARNENVQELIKVYIDICYTTNDKMEDKLKSDADELIELLINTPMTIKVKLNEGAIIKDEENIDRRILIEQTILLPNVEEKRKMYNAAQSFSEILKKVQENLKIEAHEREKEAALKRLYDSRTANETEEK